MFLGMYSYLADISTSENRTMRLAFLDTIFSLAMSIGIGVGGDIYINYG